MTAVSRVEPPEPGQEHLAEIGQRALGVAHDLGNLLGAVAGAAEALAGTLADAAPAPLAARCHDDLAAIRAGAAQAAALVRRFMRNTGHPAARPESGLAVDAALIDFAAFLRRLWGRRIEVVLDAGAAGAQAAIGADAFDQALLNLALNARDAMLDGGRLTVRTRRRDAGDAPGGWIAIEVADTGIGIAPDVIGRIFEPFFTTKRDRGGTGIGLATAHATIRAAGGRIGVRSEVGAGTCFEILLPCIAPAPAAGGAGRTVLLVEDEATLRRLAERVLGRSGWRVLCADSAEAALELLDGRTAVPDLVVCDLELPGMDGLALVGAIRARAGRPGLPAVIASGHPGAAWPGIRRLLKPYSPADLVRQAEAAAEDAKVLADSAV